ncbi:hypothetical protein VOLCADRAFT_104025 [Volvox carteri f. nagariensis]|uniref:Methyltransferase FkbM domain-containing protein n=1 Tax=Volvox carteri f. nagariensis TaxID=3068 RepID=D8TQR3_VOLCA|nr:uncharacterized protein VOLCADRAFT_104025 [Volvox carteri f. nagariensis]EFJ50078.1 hypothetical protein VOLCADRAFT_104025 [Volvox carteri f. nagariensis]|eukprot:XP_002948698.1 hypothetical protein VOLCADRAFT_104025 [Volvox carteri f. nagariensis]
MSCLPSRSSLLYRKGSVCRPPAKLLRGRCQQHKQILSTILGHGLSEVSANRLYSSLRMPSISDATADVTVGGKSYAVKTISLSDEVPAFKCLEPAEASFLYKQIFEEADYTQFGISISPGDVVVDIGGNIGAFAVYAILKNKGNISIYAFEPVPILAHICQANMELYKGKDTEYKVFTLGLTAPDKVGKIAFDFFPEYSLLSSAYDWDPSDRDAIAQKLLQFEGSNDPARLEELRQRVGDSLRKEVVEAELRTFSSVRQELGLKRIDLLKIDVEKAEWDVVCGISDDDWAMTRQAAIETHVIGDRVERIAQLLRDKGFSRVHVGEVGTPKFLGFKYYNKLHPEGDTPAAVVPNGGDDKAATAAAGGGLVCNIYATRD